MQSCSRNETVIIATHALRELVAHKDGATVLALEGELGSGKTTFVQGLAQALGITVHIVSPTFVIEKRYPVKGVHGFDCLVHIDAYRLEGSISSGLKTDEVFALPRTLVVIEWPEFLGVPLPTGAVYVRFAHKGGDCRSIEIA